MTDQQKRIDFSQLGKIVDHEEIDLTKLPPLSEERKAMMMQMFSDTVDRDILERFRRGDMGEPVEFGEVLGCYNDRYINSIIASDSQAHALWISLQMFKDTFAQTLENSPMGTNGVKIFDGLSHVQLILRQLDIAITSTLLAAVHSPRLAVIPTGESDNQNQTKTTYLPLGRVSEIAYSIVDHSKCVIFVYDFTRSCPQELLYQVPGTLTNIPMKVHSSRICGSYLELTVDAAPARGYVQIGTPILFKYEVEPT